MSLKAKAYCASLLGVCILAGSFFVYAAADGLKGRAAAACEGGSFAMGIGGGFLAALFFIFACFLEDE